MLSDRDWQLLLRRICGDECAPFLGAGACHGALPLGAEIAREWSRKYGYPLDSSSDLTRVAQFLAVEYDAMFPKTEFVRQFIKGATNPDYDSPCEPHSVLASLPLSLYMTTNYDSFMYDALLHHGRPPTRALCRWNTELRKQECILDSMTPSVQRPVAYHFHGWWEKPESLVLTEDDYLNFLVAVSQDTDLVPAVVREAMSGKSLLFIGYGLNDWSFRVLFQGLIRTMESCLRRVSITVQLAPVGPDAPAPLRARVEAYLTNYFRRMDMHVYWGTACEFAGELSERWQEFRADDRA
jgi:hypothetical protein